MKLSVVIPCHNGERYLAETLESLLRQSRPADETILVDDASTDGSAEIADRYAPKIRVLRTRCGGASRARNFGYRHTSGDALMFLDADDVLGPEALAGLVDALESTTGAIAVCPWFRLEHIDRAWARRRPSWPSRRPGHDHLSDWLMGRYYPPCAVLWSRTAYERTGGWGEDVPVNNDGDIMMRAMVMGVPIVEARTGEAFYRRLPADEQSVSSRQRSRAGRESQLRVIARVAGMLEARDALGPYRRALTCAFEKVARDCGNEFPDIVRRANDGARRYGEPEYRRLARRGIGRFRHVVQRAFGVT